MTLPQVEDLFEYWKTNPPAHVLVAAHMGYEPPKSIEQQWAEGAMNPADFFAHYQATGGKIPGLGHG